MKKNLFFIILCLLITALTLTASAYIMGDADGNGKVTASDARTALRFAAYIDIPDEKQVMLCDTNGDGKVTAADARTILRTAAYIEKPVIKNEEQTFEITATEKTEILSPNEIYEEAKKFTCEIRTYDKNGIALTVGTGFFVSSDGIIVTDFHVIDTAESAVAVMSDGRKFSITSVLGYDSKKDIALLSADAENVPFASFGSNVKVGDDIFVLGSPKGYTGTFSRGNVSAADRVITELDNGTRYIQITAPVSTGNSGGPVLDNKGNVIGIVAMSHNEAQNLNFAIPVGEIGKIDISSPVTLSELSSKSDGFSGEILLSSKGITMRKGGTAMVYAVVSASEEYTLECLSDNDSVTVFTGRNYGNVTVIYISAKENCTAGITVRFKDRNTKTAAMNVTVDDTAPVTYCGLPVSVPDFGIYSGCQVSECHENTDGGNSVFSFLYSTDSPAFEKDSAEKVMKSYMTELESYGFTFVSSSQDSTAGNFFNEENKTSLSFGITQKDDGKWYICVLIYR